ncbi:MULTISPECIES: potassium channel family protein [Peribacillus]|jgi:trk system potassium uptake protein TrkA|uniref:TrkA family potassium uptake protein n=1 Tax=Peribacillus butanolivorans TaxID=421767 RepID=A0AAX0RX36_9BACI|nr:MULTISPECIES: TrkA family potassium uptake protein [Peribacillus]KQU18906.1 potassium uptake system protein [Bacillus sp. Leaf13]KRF62586.1 potassium uptake system protein [Bacillus sp. Soil768D1]AXN38365.1 TrkA family potassium uptake protein [Peribacillus butanolivorans]KON70894.1 potassium uptake system protein [Peribacillus butanolivorans]MBK5443509.1 TrkA family potassium uptake protein [Peribacillus sp. TH24]
MGKRQYAVIGLGRFGTSVAHRLYTAGQEVLGIDVSEERVENAELSVTHAVMADTTEEEALKSIGIRNFDCVIVAIGNDMQSSILTTLLLKELGVKKVIAKALNKHHGQVLAKVGADWVIYPERDMGERVANQLLSPNMLNYIELSKEYNIEEIIIPISMTGKSLRELDLRAKYNISVIAIVSNGEIIIAPSPDQNILEKDMLLVVGNKEDLAVFANIE